MAIRREKGKSREKLTPVTVRFDAAQLRAVERAAEALGIDRAQFCRMGALREAGYIPEKPKPLLRPVPIESARQAEKKSPDDENA